MPPEDELTAALDAVARTLSGVERRTAGDVVTWATAGRDFATVSGSTAEFRLQPLVARAAVGTPDTGLSTRGRDWVRFAPRELDRFALDRAEAWLASAYRHATVNRR